MTMVTTAVLDVSSVRKATRDVMRTSMRAKGRWRSDSSWSPTMRENPETCRRQHITQHHSHQSQVTVYITRTNHCSINQLSNYCKRSEHMRVGLEQYEQSCGWYLAGVREREAPAENDEGSPGEVAAHRLPVEQRPPPPSNAALCNQTLHSCSTASACYLFKLCYKQPLDFLKLIAHCNIKVIWSL